MADVFDETKIPALNLDVETISSNASTLKTKAGNMRNAGSKIKTTWSGMSACYKAPEQETLYAAMNPVETNTDDLADDLEKIAGYVSTFASTAKGIKSDAQTLKKDGQAFKAKIAKKPDWQYDQELVNENTRLVNRASALQVRLWNAERECVNSIRALDSLPPYHADQKSDSDKLFYGSSSIPQDADKPWGKSVPRQDKCPKKAAVSVKRFLWDGLLVDGLWGDISGIADIFSADAWKGLGSLIGMSDDENGNFWFNGNEGEVAWNAWKGTFKEMSHWDMWSTDPARAAGATVYDIASLGVFAIPYAGPFIGAALKGGKVAKAAKTAKVARAASKAVKVAKVAGKVADAVDVPGHIASAAAKAAGKVTVATSKKLFPNFDVSDITKAWRGQQHGDGADLDMDSPELPELTVGKGSKAPSVHTDDPELPDLSSRPHTSDGNSSSTRAQDGAHVDTDGDTGRADVDGRRESAKDGADSAGDTDRDRAGRGADADAGRGRADHDGADGHEHVRDADGRRVDADGHHDLAKNHADADNNGDHDRTDRNSDSDGERDRSKTDSDATEGRDRARQGDGDGSHTDGEERSKHGENDTDAANGADHDGTSRNGDSDGESGRDKGNGDGSGEFPDGTRKEPLTVEERQQWIDQVDQSRDQDAFNEKHRTAGPEVKPEHQRTLGIDEQFGVGEKLDANAHYEVTRTTDDGVSYKSHYYTDASGEVRHVETSSRAMTGEYNPDLRNPLPNATYTVDGRFHYTTDGWARTVRLEVDRLDKVGEAFRSRSSYIQSKVNKYGSELAADIDQRYEGGHIVGHQFGGPPEEINTVAMLEEVNQTRVGKESNSYLLLERKFAAKPENYNNLVVEFKYSDPADPAKITNSERVPTRFEATWTDANGIPDRKRFENTPR